MGMILKLITKRYSELDPPPASSVPVVDFGRVCRAWHIAYEVKVLVPGVRGAEAKEKGKGVVVRRGLEEAQSKSAGRRTGTG